MIKGCTCKNTVENARTIKYNTVNAHFLSGRGICHCL